MLFALTYQEWLSFDLSTSVDPKTYWGLAHFEFDQSVVRKYRVIIPFLVRGLYWVVSSCAQLFRPGALQGDFMMKTCFYVINLLSSAAWCTLAYAYVRAMKRSKAASLVVIMMIVTSFWTIFNTYAFMTDSFYCCFVALTFLAITKQNHKMLFWAIMIGPFAKEAYLFLLPVIFFYSNVPKLRQLLWFAISGALVFSFRYVFDHTTEHVWPTLQQVPISLFGWHSTISISTSLYADLEHFTYIDNLIHRFEDQNYTNPLIALIGFWLLIPLGGLLLLKGFAKYLGKSLKQYMLLWFLLVFLQMIISGDFSRMLYLYLPVYGFIVATAIDYWRMYYNKTFDIRENAG